MSRSDLLRLIFLVFRGDHEGRPGVNLRKARKVTIDAPAGFPCHIDGDPVEVTYPVTVEVFAGMLPFIVKSS